MRVSELIELLEKQDPYATVFLMMLPHDPFECALAGMTTREEIERADGMEAGKRQQGTAANDVFIVQGRQLRLGSKTAWSVAVR